jgi:hypothetical protein
VWLNTGNGIFSRGQISGGTEKSSGVAVGDLDGDGDLDAFLVNTGANRVWLNEGGSAAIEVTSTAVMTTGFIPDGTEDDVMKVRFQHNGRTGDSILEMNRWDLGFFRRDCVTPLTNSEADAFIDILRVRLDDGDGNFETDGSDVTVASVDSFSIAGSIQPLSFTNDDGNVQIASAASKIYWISLQATATASIADPHQVCILFDPDSQALVEVKSPDFSASIQDTRPTFANTAAPILPPRVTKVNTIADTGVPASCLSTSMPIALSTSPNLCFLQMRTAVFGLKSHSLIAG